MAEELSKTSGAARSTSTLRRPSDPSLILPAVEVRLRLAITDLILDRRATLAEAQDALYRDDPELVARIYDQIFLGFWERSDFGMEEGRSNTAHKKKPRSKHPKPKRRERGVTISEMASEDSLWPPKGDEESSGGIRHTPDKTALYRLLEANGWLTRAPYGRKQYRWLVTDEAVKDGYGQNVDPSNLHSVILSRGRKAFPFPVFYRDKLKDIAWTLGWDLIAESDRWPRPQKDPPCMAFVSSRLSA